MIAAAALVVAACSGASTTTTGAPTAAPSTTAPTTSAPPIATTLAPLPTTLPPTTTTTVAPEVLTIWADESTAGALEALGSDFSTRRGVDVEIVTKPFPSIRSDVLGSIGDDGPDLFVGAHSWAGTLLDAGAIAPVRGIPLARQSEFIQPALEAFRIDGTLYGVPYGGESIALWVNVELAGANPPETFEQLLDGCDDLAVDVVCLAVAGGAGVPEAYYQYPFVSAFDGSILRYEPGVGYIADRAGIDEPESIEASVFLAALDRGDYLPPLDYVTAKQRFLEGEVAYWLTGYWEAEEIEAAAESRGFSVTVAPVPPINGVPARPFIDAIGVFLGTNAPTEAKIFMTDWIATGEAMLSLAPGPPLFPTHEQPAGRVTGPLRIPYVDAMRQAVPTPNVAAMSDAVWEAWGSALTAIRDEGADPETALSDAATLIRTILGIPQPDPAEDE